MGKKSDVPVRSCIGCRNRFPKENLIRFTTDPQGRVVPDPLYTEPGRGAYLCPSQHCFKMAYRKRGAFSRAFRREVKLPRDPTELSEEALRSLEREQRTIRDRLKGLREGEGRRLALSLQRIDEMVERLRHCE